MVAEALSQMSLAATLISAAISGVLAASAALGEDTTHSFKTAADVRAALVEMQMTVAERFQLLHGIMSIPITGLPPIPAGLPITAGYIRGVPRLGVPDIVETDAGLGVANPFQLRAGDVATAMPSGLALAATFDSSLVYQVGALIGTEARAKGFNVLLGGGVNLARDPRNGRNFEYLGEDPLLAGTMAGSMISGTQSAGVVSTVKHFLLNDQETLRDTLDARIDEAALRESDLLAFELAIERGQPGSVMCAYNQVNGEHACGSDFLLKQVLKGDWGYRGWVMSDWGAVHDVSYFSKGLDQQSGSQLDKQVWFDGPLQADVAAGRVSEARISEAVRRILRSLFAVGADRPAFAPPIDYLAHAALARRAAANSIVLLKNEGILPLSPALRKILIVGGHADIGVLSGGGSSQVTPYGGAPVILPIGGPGVMQLFGRELYMPSPPLEAIRAALPLAVVEFQSGYDIASAAAAAGQAEVVVVFVTQWQVEGADHGSMSLPEGQDALISAVAHENPNTIVVLETGNPVNMPWIAEVKGILEAWYPGQEGGSAIADVLIGSVNPSGHLPMTFPMDESQLPRSTIPGFGLPDKVHIDVTYLEGSKVGYRWFASRGIRPRFPFGHGLSYTDFDTTKLTLTINNGIRAKFVIRNSGNRVGEAVPQLYLISAAGETTLRLVGYSKVSLVPGEEQTIDLIIDPRFLARWDITHHCWRMDKGRYDFALGESATELSQPVGITLRAQTQKP
jgi:beta-glucosidase